MNKNKLKWFFTLGAPVIALGSMSTISAATNSTNNANANKIQDNFNNTATSVEKTINEFTTLYSETNTQEALKSNRAQLYSYIGFLQSNGVDTKEYKKAMLFKIYTYHYNEVVSKLSNMDVKDKNFYHVLENAKEELLVRINNEFGQYLTYDDSFSVSNPALNQAVFNSYEKYSYAYINLQLLVKLLDSITYGNKKIFDEVAKGYVLAPEIKENLNVVGLLQNINYFKLLKIKNLPIYEQNKLNEVYNVKLENTSKVIVSALNVFTKENKVSSPDATWYIVGVFFATLALVVFGAGFVIRKKTKKTSVI
ncbi:hypothetical protein GE118_03530 [Mycoplasma sp. NEAQ87857]|uniref:hypothetical protein n=1 Tax=Mycoplasma sp. NEAQ87857 TaxID=2683967 RepID=UPI001319A9B1|nr:hypothetical protein [Mycoplasma sp. NEAQ87857]QGZ97853.1 hypothetical protein GE118_03530 [Mycoplasma sp. NEAQ87857]